MTQALNKSFLQVDVPRQYLQLSKQGDVSSLIWTSLESSKETAFPTFKVKYASLNFRDIMLATGKLPSEAIAGDFKRLNKCFISIMQPLTSLAICLNSILTPTLSSHQTPPTLSEPVTKPQKIQADGLNFLIWRKRCHMVTCTSNQLLGRIHTWNLQYYVTNN